ncbi:hypothetical protein [Deinococcus pimensis]|uniref:hypothetical protein n=1 Tax=Deinococcus pimensis TaxID=309888 RepID=UPI0004879A2E|nr:hypothetical protein [Deinococcus pimensis]
MDLASGVTTSTRATHPMDVAALPGGAVVAAQGGAGALGKRETILRRRARARRRAEHEVIPLLDWN